MTDNEIIKALERMSAEDADGFSSDILDLIKRQQAEIERLKNVPPVATVVFDKNDIRNILAEKFGDIETTIKEMRSEAITEFAERLKAEILEWQYEFEYYDERWDCQFGTAQMDIYVPVKRMGDA